MIDPQRFRQHDDTLLHLLQARGMQADAFNKLVALQAQRRQLLQQCETLRAELNQQSKQAAPLPEAAREIAKAHKTQLKQLEEALRSTEAALLPLMLLVPNLPWPNVPAGRDAQDNVVVRTHGQPPAFAFAPKAHWDLVEQLDIVDFAQARQMSGARFALYKGAGARLERALAALMLDLARSHGYLEVAPPLLVRFEAMQTTGQFPQLQGDSFVTSDDGFALIPTAEVPLVNLHTDTIFDIDVLPRRYTAHTSCFRREAGAAGRDTRGLLRLHQFNKVELVSFCTPEQSEAEHLVLLGHAEKVLQVLQLPYRVVELCHGDLGFAAARTFDLEVWLPSSGEYREISSCSNCGDFQARRGKIRFRSTGGKPQLVHTLNGSALAVGRCFVAVLENGQQADGSIVLPEALAAYFGEKVIAAPVANHKA